MLTITLDWVSFTLKDINNEAEKWISVYACPDESVPGKPVKNYTDAYITNDAVLYCWNTRRAEMGHHVVLSGSALRNIWKRHDIQQKELLEQVLYIGGRVSRLDIAKDLPDVPVNYDKIFEKAIKRDYVGSARTPEQHRSEDGGNSVYIGSRKSDKFFRIYNKIAEQKLQDGVWSRFEIETKGLVARALAQLLVRTDNWSGVFDKMAKDMFSPNNCPDYDAFFSAGVVPIGLPKLERTSDREKWISSQVLPAVAKHFSEHRDSPAIKLLMDTLNLIARE